MPNYVRTRSSLFAKVRIIQRVKPAVTLATSTVGRFMVLNLPVFVFKVSKKANIRNRYNQVLQLTQDTIWGSDKNTRKHHIQESKEVSPFPAGDHKAAINRQETMTNTEHK